MRLKPATAEAITKTITNMVGGICGTLYLFGSRADDQKRGGDIDLLFLGDRPSVDALQEKKYRILANIKQHIGDQKIDLTLAELNQVGSDPFLSSIVPTAVFLKEWL